MPWWFYALLVLAAIGLYLFASYFIYRKFIRVGTSVSSGLVDQTSPFFRQSWEWYKSVPRTTVRITGYDGTKLAATYITSADAASTRTAILCHGYRSIDSDLAILAEMYSGLGFKILLPDARAHGLSGGSFTSFGRYERFDLRKWIDYVLMNFGAGEEILIHGVSMGASTAFLTAAGDIPRNVRAVVADSPFASVWGVYARVVRPHVLLVFLPGLEFWCRYLHRFFLFRINVRKAIADMRIPFLIIHCVGDRITPYAASERMAAASSAPFKEVYAVHSGVHAEGYKTDREGIDRRIANLVQTTFMKRK
jgi:alpha-beta hydrolase superfamily lysophospholipase